LNGSTIPHEIIVVDDNSPDGTIHVAKRLADVAITKAHINSNISPNKKPKLFYAGSAISITMLILCIIYISKDKIKTIYEKYAKNTQVLRANIKDEQDSFSN